MKAEETAGKAVLKLPLTCFDLAEAEALTDSPKGFRTAESRL